ncbi:MAG: choice-of-anchor Q domain-containing protein [Tepidisphaerales bacterium]
MLETIRAAFTKCFGPDLLSSGNSSRGRASGWGVRRGQSGRQLGRATSAAIESLESRRLLTAFVVNTLLDQNDATGSSVVSLRDAIAAANASASVNPITFAPALTAHGPATITLTLGVLTLTNTTKITITGPGASLLSISGDNATSIFNIASSSFAVISGLTMTGARDASLDGGGILNSGILTITASTVSGNAAGQGAGGILNSAGATLTISGSTVSGNTANTNGGGITNAGMLTIVDSTVSGNTVHAYDGGGIYNIASGTLTVIGSTFSGNTAGGQGGGITNWGTMTVTNSTFYGNSAGQSGGAIVSSGSLTLTGSTISGNTTGNGASGGGIYVQGTLNLDNTLIAGNTASNNPDVAGAVSTGGCNLIGDGTGMSGLTNRVARNQVGTSASPINPQLGFLASNGGPTQTMALLPGSPAIDAGANLLIPDGVTTDQRGPGFSRIADSVVDIGAFEVAETTPPTPQLTTPIKLTRKGTAPYSFIVVYTDPATVLLSSIGNRNIKITGPRSFSVFATSFTAVSSADGTTVTATYHVAAPKGGWTSLNNGTYKIILQANQVEDLLNNRDPLATLGQFTVAIK